MELTSSTARGQEIIPSVITGKDKPKYFQIIQKSKLFFLSGKQLALENQIVNKKKKKTMSTSKR